MAAKPKYAVMLSSTYRELAEHRKMIQQAMLGQELFPVAMESDAALPDHDLISASLAKVDEADAYVGLLSYRYGQTPQCSERNPDRLSLTELEFRRAVERKIPICMFIMSGDHPVPRRAVGDESDAERRKLEAFMVLAKQDRIYAEFDSVADLKAKAIQSLVKLREAIDKRTVPVGLSVGVVGASPKPLDQPPGWVIVDRDALARIRANPPSLDVMVQFFDGILPTWPLVVAPGVQSRAVAERLANRLRAAHASAAKPAIVLLAGAGGEGKSTAILHAAAALVEDMQQAWTCLHRQAANAGLPEETFSKLPIVPGHAWVVVIDDADNIGPAILAAVKKVSARMDVHILLAARDADWQLTRLVPGMWQPFADFHTELLAGLDREDARRIVASWVAWGDKAMGKLEGRSEGDAVTALLGHARDFATRKEDGELLGALLVTRQGEDMRAHVRTLVNGLGRNPVIKTYGLRDIYAMVAVMHSENQLYLSRSVLGFALGCEVSELERSDLLSLRREAMLDSGDTFVLTRHRRIAEAACEVMREDGDNVDRWYPFLARAGRLEFKNDFTRDHPNVRDWTFGLSRHFLERGERWWTIARAVAKAIYEVEPSDPLCLTALSSVFRQTGQVSEAMQLLKATGERLRNRRDVLYEWGTVAGTIGDDSLAAWLQGRSLADGEMSALDKSIKHSLAGLGVAFRSLLRKTDNRIFAVAYAACGDLGVRLPMLNATNQRHLEMYVAEGRRNGVAELSPVKAVDAIRKAVILALQLLFCFEVRALGGGLVGSTPE